MKVCANCERTFPIAPDDVALTWPKPERREPREWDLHLFFDPPTSPGTAYFVEVDLAYSGHDYKIPVIEKSAYDAVVRELDEYVAEAERFQHKCLDLDQANGMLRAENEELKKVHTEHFGPAGRKHVGELIAERDQLREQLERERELTSDMATKIAERVTERDEALKEADRWAKQYREACELRARDQSEIKEACAEVKRTHEFYSGTAVLVQRDRYRAALESAVKQLDWYANVFNGEPHEFEHWWRVELPHELREALEEK